MIHTRKLEIAAITAMFLLLPITAFAAEFRVGEQPSLPSGETLVNDLYIVGGTVNVGGTVRGDAVTGGGTLILNGPVTGDILATGGNITIVSDVGDDVRVAGGNITIQGRVADDLLIGGGQISIGGKGVGGDIAIGGGVVRIEAPVTGNIMIGGGDVYINATVGGNVNIKAEKIRFGPKTVVSGDFTYSSPEMAVLEEGAIIRGETNFTKSPDVEGAAKAGAAALFSLWFISKFLMSLAGAFTLAYIFRKFARTVVREAGEETLLEIGRGLVTFIVLPIASIILLATVVGVPFGLLGLVAFVAFMIVASLMAPVVIGSLLHKWVKKPLEYQVTWKTILLGVVIYALLPLIPLIGGIAKFAILLLTLGAIVNIKWGILKEWR
ncbi:hypothetical protein C4585_03425 [Candidatus Parcubacteria bacterium]|nr:MAG: hypothetical protein C4585_03425 [Candidatus Parcubacteria bacterium]